MSDDTRSVDVVVIGAGIVGNSLGYHLAKLGTRRILLIDKGGLPNPGGSTGHASNFIFPFEHSKMMTDLTTESTRQYKELGVFTESGGIEVVRTEARLQECLRKMSGAKSWGIEASMLTPAEVNKLVPYLDERTILGGLYFPRTGVVDSLRAGTLMREEAIAMGALEILANTEVTGFRKRNGRVSGVETTSGLVECGAAVICCGVWSPRIARMAGATVPLTPVVHQMVSVGPIELFGDSAGEIEYPIVRDVDKGMYERQHGGDMEVGSYAHRPILVEPDDIPPLELSVLSPTELPFTNDDFDPQMADALELMPELLGDERAGIRYAINGLISLTPDGRPLFGETEVRGLWCAAAVWIKEGPGSARTVAEWMTGTHPAVDAHEADISRFYRHQRTRQFVAGRAEEMYNKTYGIVHPAEQFLNSRNIRTSPMHQRERQLGAVFFETGGWERPNWYESNAPLLERYGDKVTVRHAEWDTRWWSPIAEAEHLAMRDRVGLVDLGAFAILDVHGQGALGVVQSVAVAQMDVPVGRVVYTPLLDPDGGMKADLTVMRLSPTRFRVVTGAAHGMSEKAWFENHLPEDGSTQVTDLTSAWTTIGVWARRPAHLSTRSRQMTCRATPFASARADRSSLATSRYLLRESLMSASPAGNSTSRQTLASAHGTSFMSGVNRLE